MFGPTSRLDEDRPVRIRWDFLLPDGSSFTSREHARLLESAKEHLAAIRTHSVRHSGGRRAASVRTYFQALCALVRWMMREGFKRFSDLPKNAPAVFMRVMSQRKGRDGAPIARTTLEHFAALLIYLHQHRRSIADALQIEPFPGQRAGAVARSYRKSRASWPYTPDIVAVPLVQGAIELLSCAAIDILRARERYAAAALKTRQRGLTVNGANYSITLALRQQVIHLPQGTRAIKSISDFVAMIEHLYTACFVIIAYLVGPRLSEILHLHAGCLQPAAILEPSSGPHFSMLVGTIFKHESYHGRSHQWLAPTPVVHAIAVLEALSSPHRLRTGRQELWLRPRNNFGSSEWQPDYSRSLRLPSVLRMNDRLERFGTWLGLPQHEGQHWRLSTHQGRKTFARFVALRDRTSLFALAQHLGHRERSLTDQHYAGTDYVLEHEIDAAVLEQSVCAWEHMLSAPHLGGRAGEAILARRPRFRGTRIKSELKRYARMLAEAGLILGVCDWGYCVYREEYSACRGNASGPNAVNREPSTCVRCKNFVVSEVHRDFWLEQVCRHEALLNEAALPSQTLKIARTRLDEARAMIRSIGISVKDPHHGS
ncbi:MAG TPA: hypothetical protein VI653_31310 [Steroidobacteraceae bacterium]